jgi:tryptophan synthase alpha chain
VTGSLVGDRLAEASARGGALIGYLPIGYPDLATSIRGAVTLAEAGVDVLELGLPYSDPVMDGPVIQAATQQALANGFRLRHAFDAVREVTAAADVPALLMTYWNPVLQYGAQRFADDLAAAGGAGLITPDLIPDEAGEWLAASDEQGLDRVFLVAPSSSDARIASTAAASRGFVYASAVMGVTGARSSVGAAASGLVERLRRLAPDIPVCVGLGVSTGEQAAQVASFADGVIVGSALVKCLLDSPDERGIAAVRELSEQLAAGVRRFRG